MTDKIKTFYITRIFSFAGCVDWFIFIASLAVLFYDYKFFNIKKLLIFIAHLAGLYVAMLIFVGLTCMITDIDIILNYLPKFLAMVLYAVFFSKYKWQSKVILCALMYSLNHLFIEVGGCLSGVLGANGSGMDTEYIRYGMMLCTVGAALLLRFFNIEKFRSVPTGAVVEVVAFSGIGVMLAILRSSFIPYFSKFEQTEDYKYSLYPHLYILIILFCIIVFIFACYFFLIKNIKTSEANIELNGKLLRLENVEDMVAVNENNLKQIYKLKHEMKNRYAVMQVMLAKKQYDKLENYFGEINSEAVIPLSRVNTGNAFFDTVFDLEISKAEARKIEVSTKLIVPPELPISEADFGGLITNLMDNAIEACDKIENAPKLINVAIQTIHSYLILRISNTVSAVKAKTALSLVTDKPNKNLHGLGTKIIDDIVKKYDGQILRRVENNVFYVDIMLDIDTSSGGGRVK